VEWLKVWTLSSSPKTAKKKKEILASLRREIFSGRSGNPSNPSNPSIPLRRLRQEDSNPAWGLHSENLCQKKKKEKRKRERSRAGVVAQW
jgi:hypothetical protein